MAQKLLSVSLGTTSAKLSEIAKSGRKVSVYSCYDIQLPEGLCDDGVINDVEGLAEVLRHYIATYHIKTKKIVFSIASKRIASKEVVIPFVKEKQIKGIIDINAPEYFPVANIEDYVLSYSIIEIVKTAENSQYRMNVTATPNSLLLAYNELAAALRLDIVTIDFSGNAILQVIKQQTVPGEVCAILQLGYENTVINLMNGPIQVMQRTVSTGLSTILATICDSVHLDEEDAVAFLEDNDITRIAGAYPDVKYVLDTLISSIGRIFDFYNGRSQDHPITSVMFIGDATYINGIGDALAEGLGHETTEIKQLVCVDVKGKQINHEIATNFMSTIGAVLNSMNLKYVEKGDKEDGKEKSEKLPWGMVVFSALLSIALVGGSFAFYYITNQKQKAMSLQLSNISEILTLETQLNDANARKAYVLGLYEATEGPGDSLLTLIKDLETIMPKGTAIDSLNISDDSVSITASGIGKDSVAKLIQEIKALNYIEDVKVDFISETIEGIEKYDAFTMTFKLLNVNYVGEDAQNAEAVQTDAGDVAMAEVPADAADAAMADTPADAGEASAEMTEMVADENTAGGEQ